MKRFLALLLALAMSFVLMSACGGDAEPANEPAPAAAPAASSEPATSSEPAASTDPAASTEPAAEPAVANKDVLRIAANAEAKSLDPTQTVDASSQQIYNDIYETLLEVDADKNIVPKLAEYEKIDDTTFVFHIKQGVKFHNGEELKASDVVFTFERGMAAPVLKNFFGDVASVTATGDYDVEVKLTKISAPFIAGLTSPATGICNEKAVTEAGDDYGTKPCGTGPYKLASWEMGVKLTLERNEEYWGEKPVYKTIEVTAIPEGTNRTIELESGNVDIALEIPETDHERVRTGEGLELLQQPSYAITYLGFNCGKAPFDDVRVRQAVSYALDVPTLVKAVKGDTVAVANGPFSNNLMFYKDNPDVHQFDTEKAKALLAEAGYADGLSVTITCDEKKENNDIALIVQAQLKQIGIDVEIVTMEWATYLTTAYAGDTQMYIIGWGCQTPDPDTVVYACFHSSNCNGGNNLSNYVNATADELLDRGRTTYDAAERTEIYAELQDVLAEDCPWVYLWVRQYFVGIGGSVESMVLDPNSAHYYYKVK